ncbi:MAG TPA: hypothetical protein VK991_08720 [Halomonas sp.]|nr:hypothetical protein [Halomonas sp.]
MGNMEKKTARLTLLIDPHKKRAFEQLCAAQDLTPSQVVRQLIRDYLHSHDVTYKTQPPAYASRGDSRAQQKLDADK